jgi:hypothetical protein
MNATISPDNDHERWRCSIYVLVALAALFTGYVLGLLGGGTSGGSRANWPPPPTNPRSLHS